MPSNLAPFGKEDPFGEEDRKEWLRDQQLVKRKIVAVSGVKRDIARLSKIKAEQDEILDILAVVVGDPELSWRKHIRVRQKQLLSLAGQLETVAKHAERLLRDPFVRGSSGWRSSGKSTGTKLRMILLRYHSGT
jgi:hypothetical protein